MIHMTILTSVDKNTWGYAFFTDTLLMEDVDKIGLAANDIYGNTAINIMKF